MGRFSRKHDDLGRQLSAARPRPSAELVEGIAARVSARPTPRRYSRVAFGLALATFMAGLFATFGGVGYAASGVTDTVRQALEKLAKQDWYEQIRALRGKVHFTESLDSIREDRD